MIRSLRSLFAECRTASARARATQLANDAAYERRRRATIARNDAIWARR